MDLQQSDRALAPVERWMRIVETAMAAADLGARAFNDDVDDVDLAVEYDEKVERLVALITAPEAAPMVAAVLRVLASGAGVS